MTEPDEDVTMPDPLSWWSSDLHGLQSRSPQRPVSAPVSQPGLMFMRAPSHPPLTLTGHSNIDHAWKSALQSRASTVLKRYGIQPLVQPRKATATKRVRTKQRSGGALSQQGTRRPKTAPTHTRSLRAGKLSPCVANQLTRQLRRITNRTRRGDNATERAVRALQSRVRSRQHKAHGHAMTLQSSYRGTTAKKALRELRTRRDSSLEHWRTLREALNNHMSETLSKYPGGTQGPSPAARAGTVEIAGSTKGVAVSVGATADAHGTNAQASDTTVAPARWSVVWAGNYQVNGRAAHIKVSQAPGHDHLLACLYFYTKRRTYNLVLGHKQWRAKGYGPLHTLSPTRLTSLCAQLCEDLHDSKFDHTVLSKVPFLAHVEDEVAQSICEVMASKAYIPGEKICKQGDIGDSMYFVMKGTLGVFVGDQKVGELADSSAFGEVALLRADGRRTATVVAQTHASLFVLSSVDFRRIVARFPRMERRLQDTIRAYKYNI